MPSRKEILSKEIKEFEPFRYNFLKFIIKKRKSADEILNHGFNLGYSNGYKDGLNDGYAERIREEQRNKKK